MSKLLFVTEESLEDSDGASINSKGTYKALSLIGECDLIAGKRYALPDILLSKFNSNYDFLWLRGLLSTYCVETLKRAFTIYDINGVLHEEHKLKGGSKLECLFIKSLQKRCANNADLVKVHTENMKKYFLDIGVSSDFIKVPPIIDISHYSYVKNEFDSKSNVNVGYSGNAREWQGLPILLKAFESLADVPDLFLSLIGPSKKDILTSSNNVFLLDKCSHDEYVSEIIPKFDIFVVPRPSNIVTETTTPIKLIEAMASGIPVIASDVGGISEYIQHNVNGYLVEPGNPDALADAIFKVSQNPKLAYKLAVNARKTAEKTFDYNIIGAQLYKKFEIMGCQ